MKVGRSFGKLNDRFAERRVFVLSVLMSNNASDYKKRENTYDQHR